MKEAERIKNLIPEVPLTYTAGRNEKPYQSLIGAWTDGDHSEWTPEFLPGGKVVNRDGKTDVWHWIDAEAGVIGSGNGWSNLYYIEKPGLIRTISKKRDRNTLTKIPGQKVPPTDSVILNLHSSEVAQRAAFTALTTAQRKRVLDCVIAQAKSLPAEEATELFKDVRRVESTVDERSGRAGMLMGVWKWDSTELSFQSHGIVTGKDGRKIGTWGWVDTGTIDFAVVLKGGKGADDVFIASPPNAGQTSVQVYPMVGKAFTATRSLK